jgi:PAS domain S-box
LLISIAAAIEARGKLISSEDRLEFMSESLIISNNALEATLASVDEAIVTINRDGQIMNVNPEASRILRIKPEDVGSKNIREFLSEQSDLLELSANEQSVSTNETILVLGQERKYTINIRPILNHSTGKLDMAVLKLTPPEKNIEKSNRVGNTTRFRFEDIIGDSKVMKQAIELGQRFAGTMEAILLMGESGTGKELFAQAIHNYMHPNGPFMAVNCAAMPKNLIESELFGYEGGSFTGADRTGRPGKIELATGGTLFLDEIGDMHLELQSVLLRVLEDKQVTRIGGKQSKKVDFRVVAATNRNLYEMVREKAFREDLYFRLSVLPINLPPLRARGNDVLILSRYFVEEYCNKIGFKVPELSPEAQNLILKYNWPGNVRQLQNAIYYAVNTSQGNVIESHNLPEFILYESHLEPVGAAPSVDMGNEPLSIKKLEKAAIDLALLQSHNSIPRAAEMLGMSKATLYRKLKEFSAND